MKNKTLSEHAHAAQLIRTELKKRGIKASVKSRSFSMGNAVDIDLQDENPAIFKQVQDYCDQYQCGNFDGMTDSYDYSNVRKDIPQVKYVQIRNHFSDALNQKIWDFIRARYVGLEDAPADYTDGYNYRSEHWRCYGGDLVHRASRDEKHKFWQQEKAA